ncbi:hypothetical protein Tco_1290353 [Tanacetum coccineum]
MIVMTLMTKLESLFGPLFDEYLNGENQVVSKSFVVTTADASDKCQQQSDSTSSTSTPGPIVTAGGNFDLVILFSFTVTNGNPSSVNIKQHCDIPAMRTSKYGESNALSASSYVSVLEDPTLRAGNPIKEILLK